MSSTFRFVWDGNVLLHETFKKDNSEHTELTTWVFEGFVPTAKLVNGKAYSIISDHLGTPILAVDSDGMEVWNRQLDIYGRVRKEYKHSSLEDEVFPFVPFLYQGQYYDFETNLAYNRYRYYSPETGAYISQDPIGLAGGNPTLYGYVKDPNIWLDVLGLTCEEEIKKLPPFQGLSADEIIRKLESENYYMIRNTDQSKIFIKYTADDNMYASVRIDKGNPRLQEGFAGRIDHAHKETATDYEVNNRDWRSTVGTTIYNDQGERARTEDYHQTHIPIIINENSTYEYRYEL